MKSECERDIIEKPNADAEVSEQLREDLLRMMRYLTTDLLR